MTLLLNSTSAVEVLLPPEQLLPTEEYNEERVCDLLAQIRSMGVWTRRIAIELGSKVVMDGHHRLEVAKRLDLEVVPCLLLSYDAVYVSSRRSGVMVSAAEIIRRGSQGELYPEKSTRHIFHTPHELACEIDMSLLRRGPRQTSVYPSPQTIGAGRPSAAVSTET